MATMFPRAPTILVCHWSRTVHGATSPLTNIITGRPWSQYARVCFQKTSMTDVINHLGWTEWSTSTPNTENVTFVEYGNTGAGSKGPRANFSSELTEPISISTLLGSDWEDWVDTSYIN